MATGATSTIHSLSGSGEHEAWFPLNVLVIATNRSCLLVRTLLCFAGLLKQPSFGLLWGILYLEACKSRSASGIQSEITTVRKSSLFFCFLTLLLFFRKTENLFFFLHCWFQHVRLCCELVGFCCKGCVRLWSLVSIHRQSSRVVLRPANTCMETRLNDALERSNILRSCSQLTNFDVYRRTMPLHKEQNIFNSFKRIYPMW